MEFCVNCADIYFTSYHLYSSFYKIMKMDLISSFCIHSLDGVWFNTEWTNINSHHLSKVAIVDAY